MKTLHFRQCKSDSDTTFWQKQHLELEHINTCRYAECVERALSRVSKPEHTWQKDPFQTFPYMHVKVVVLKEDDAAK